MDKIWLVVTDIDLGYEVLCAYDSQELAVKARDRMNKSSFDYHTSKGEKWVEGARPPYYLVEVPVNIDAKSVSDRLGQHVRGYDPSGKIHMLYAGQWPKDD